MIHYLKTMIIFWQIRDIPRRELQEMYALTVLAARRCAYDLAHAASAIRSDSDDPFGQAFYDDRSHQWLGIFQPTGGKQYRHELHSEIARLERRVAELERRCTQAGIDPGGEPF